MQLRHLLSELAPSVGFGGVAGFAVGFTAKRLTKIIAIALGATFILMQLLAYSGWVTVHWYVVEKTTTEFWNGTSGVSFADRVWEVITANLPFAGAFAAGFVVGFRAG